MLQTEVIYKSKADKVYTINKGGVTVLSKEEINQISQMFQKEVNKAAEKLIEANRQVEEEQKNYFKETEKLLYNYSALKLKVVQDEEDSKDIIRFSTVKGDKTPEEIVQEEFERSKRASVERTKLRVKEIERGLDRIRSNKYYRVVELKYGIPPKSFKWDSSNASEKLQEYQPLSIEEIAAKIDCDDATVKRHRSRLVNAIKIAIWGLDVT
jgi:hypothetical protein